MRPTKCSIDKDAITYNLARCREIAPNTRVISMVKANAYGLGIKNVAPALRETDMFGVTSIDEALELQSVCSDKPIVLMEGFFSRDEIDIILQQQLIAVLHNIEQLEYLCELKLSQAMTVWIKIDTGMNRLGFASHEMPRVQQLLQRCPALQVMGYMTHFPDAFLLDKTTTRNQVIEFNECIKGLSGARSLANSAGVIAWPISHADWIRPGLMLYGVSPFEDKVASDHDLKPVLSITSELIAIRQCKRGDAIGYAGTYVCPEDMPIGVIAIGYGDGYPRHAQNGTPVWVNGKLAPLAGRVSMDMLTVDLRQHPEAKVGDSVELCGPNLPIEVVANHASTIPYEIMCHITNRIR